MSPATTTKSLPLTARVVLRGWGRRGEGHRTSAGPRSQEGVRRGRALGIEVAVVEVVGGGRAVGGVAGTHPVAEPPSRAAGHGGAVAPDQQDVGVEGGRVGPVPAVRVRPRHRSAMRAIMKLIGLAI